jgi:hypothetical protein
MSSLHAFGSGLAGAVALNVVHESVRQVVPDAPRIDRLGQHTLVRLLEGANITPPASDTSRYALTLAGDIISNTFYYSAVATGEPETAPARGAMLGLTAGLGAVLLPRSTSLPQNPTSRTPTTALLTVGWYTIGGLVAGVTYRWLRRRQARHALIPA